MLHSKGHPGRRGRGLPEQILIGLLLCGLLSALSAPLQAAGNPEYKIKAALIYKLAKFVSWPDKVFADADQPLRICVLGKNPFDDALQAISSRTVAGRSLTVGDVSGGGDLQGCQLVFVADSEERQLGATIAGFSGQPILTVSDIEGFARRGGMVEIGRSGKRLEIRINPDAAQRAGVQIAAPLLGMANIVEDER